MVEAIVEHDYNAKQPDELTIKKGDVIRDIVKKQDGWSEGILDGRKGLFPDNFVTMVQVKMRTNAPNIRKCRVVYSYKQEHEDELNLNVGDIIDIVGEDEEGWWRGKLNGKTGVFPSNFVEEIPPSGPEQPKEQHEMKEPKQTKIYCEVKYAYQAQNTDELTLKEGDLVTLISKEGQDAGWWRGELNGKMGVFPDNFVTIVELPEDRLQDDKEKVEKRQSSLGNHTKHVTSQRRSHDSSNVKLEKGELTISHVATTTFLPSPNFVPAPPAVPNKKPGIQFKKSPSGSGGIFSNLAGITKKISDTIDGTTSSKSVLITTEHESMVQGEVQNAFDLVERYSMLQDVRASRVKAPGRRPPSVALKESDAIVNGNSDYGSLEDNVHTNNEHSDTASQAEIKPKSLECQKPPWLAEMKMNMKRTSPSPGPEKANKLEASTGSIDENKSPEVSPVDMSKSMPAIALHPKRADKAPKTPSGDGVEKPERKKEVVTEKSVEKAPLRTKPTVNVRPQSIEAVAVKPITKTSPTVHKPPIADRSSIEIITNRQYNELNEKIATLESELQRQAVEFRAALEDLRGKLQVESDMRMLLQAELEKLHMHV